MANKKKTLTERLTITLGEDQLSALKTVAASQRVSSATVIRWAIDEYIDRHAGKSTKSASRQ
jgi:hypothetical protein